MDKYIKLNIGFWDRIRFLLFSILPEEVLPTIEKEIIHQRRDFDVRNYYKEEEMVNISEEKDGFMIPFFDEDDDVKSNLL